METIEEQDKQTNRAGKQVDNSQVHLKDLLNLGDRCTNEVAQKPPAQKARSTAASND